MCIIKVHLEMVKKPNLGLKRVVERKECNIYFSIVHKGRPEPLTFGTGIRRFTQLNYGRD